jgi:hypothetical protein
MWEYLVHRVHTSMLLGVLTPKILGGRLMLLQCCCTMLLIRKSEAFVAICGDS